MRSAQLQLEGKRLGNELPELGKANSLCKNVKIYGVCFACLSIAATLSGPRRAQDKDIPGYRCSGKIRLTSIRCSTVPVAPPAVKKYKLQLCTLFRPLCPAFSFADVDTYEDKCVDKCVAADMLPYCSAHDEWLIMKLLQVCQVQFCQQYVNF